MSAASEADLLARLGIEPGRVEPGCCAVPGGSLAWSADGIELRLEGQPPVVLREGDAFSAQLSRTQPRQRTGWRRALGRARPALVVELRAARLRLSLRAASVDEAQLAGLPEIAPPSAVTTVPFATVRALLATALALGGQLARFVEGVTHEPLPVPEAPAEAETPEPPEPPERDPAAPRGPTPDTLLLLGATQLLVFALLAAFGIAWWGLGATLATQLGAGFALFRKVWKRKLLIDTPAYHTLIGGLVAVQAVLVGWLVFGGFQEGVLYPFVPTPPSIAAEDARRSDALVIAFDAEARVASGAAFRYLWSDDDSARNIVVAPIVGAGWEPGDAVPAWAVCAEGHYFGDADDCAIAWPSRPPIGTATHVGEFEGRDGAIEAIEASGIESVAGAPMLVLTSGPHAGLGREAAIAWGSIVLALLAWFGLWWRARASLEDPARALATGEAAQGGRRKPSRIAAKVAPAQAAPAPKLSRRRERRRRQRQGKDAPKP